MKAMFHILQAKRLVVCTLIIAFSILLCGAVVSAKTDAEAVAQQRKLAEAGDTLAQFNLGEIYYKGLGVPKDYREAFKWTRMAAENGNELGMASLGWFYARGQGVSKDYQKALKWFRKAAETGNATAQMGMAMMYSQGYGVAKDRDEMIRWLRLAAKQDHKMAIKFLNRLGEPISLDPTVVIHEVKVEPKVVSPGSRFNLLIKYSASLPGKQGGKVPVELSYSILKGDKVLFTDDPRVVKIPNGGNSTVEVRVTASRNTGLYTIESKAVHKTATDTKRVAFEIR